MELGGWQHAGALDLAVPVARYVHTPYHLAGRIEIGAGPTRDVNFPKILPMRKTVLATCSTVLAVFLLNGVSVTQVPPQPVYKICDPANDTDPPHDAACDTSGCHGNGCGPALALNGKPGECVTHTSEHCRLKGPLTPLTLSEYSCRLYPDPNCPSGEHKCVWSPTGYTQNIGMIDCENF